jgi:hypothetical protein
VKLDAGYKALEFEGAAFVGDKDAPAGTLIGMTTRWVEWRILPKDQDLAGIMQKVVTGQYEENAEKFPAGLPIALLPLARTSDQENYLAVCTRSWWSAARTSSHHLGHRVNRRGLPPTISHRASGCLIRWPDALRGPNHMADKTTRKLISEPEFDSLVNQRSTRSATT